MKSSSARIPLCAATLVMAAAALCVELSTIHFVDTASARGVDGVNTYGGKTRKDYILETTGNGVAVFDYDGDGANDLLFVNGTTFDAKSSGSKHVVQLYHNDGKGNFIDVSAKAGFTVEAWGQGVCVGDYDNDGRPDLLITYYGHNRLYHNQGDGTFRDLTSQAGLPVSGTAYGSGCSFLDYDRDGNLDLFVANYVDLDLAKTPRPGSGTFCEWKGLQVMCGPRGLPLARNHLYHNRGDGTFEDVSDKSGVWKSGGRYGLGVAAADFDNDGWPDIYVACDMTPSLLYRNNHDGTFEERGAAAGVAYNFDGQLQAGMGVAVADFDGNGFLDIAKTNFSGDVPSLYKNEDGKFFTDVSQEAGFSANHLLGWGIAFADLDEDGWKDLIIANGHVYPEVEKGGIGEQYLQKTLCYRNLGNGRFADVTKDGGPAFDQPRPARGLAVGDLDGDGRPEIAIVNMNSKPSLLKNDGRQGNFLYLTLRGTKSNRSAIGARVTVRAGGRNQIDEVMSGGSFYSQNDLSLHFGLGDAAEVERLEIRWPSGIHEHWTNVRANQKLKVAEGTGVHD
jgi:enediyne biosynthesis protein E4